MTRPMSAKSTNGQLKDININPKVSAYHADGPGRVLIIDLINKI